MSYILDALKKSERQRRLGREPLFKQAASGAGPGSRRMLLVGIAVTLFLAAAITTILLEWPAPVAPATTPAAPAPFAAPAPAHATESPPAPAEASAPAVSAAPVEDLAGQARVPVAATPARRTAGKAGASGEAPWLSSLPEAFRRSLPPLVVNIHVFAPDEAQRILYINNRPVRRGETVQGVVVEDIVEDGVVLEYRGQRFKLPRPS